MPFEPINPPQFPTPIAPYSAGAKAGNTVYVSGVLALGEGGAVLHVGDAAAQTRHVLDVIRITLEAAPTLIFRSGRNCRRNRRRWKPTRRISRRCKRSPVA